MNTDHTISNTTRDGTTKDIKEQGVGPHYWASGQPIDDWKEYPSAFLDREITDAPMQIIKFGEFCRITGGEDILRKVPAGLQSIAKHWVRSLHERNKGGVYAFPRMRDEETGKFYLVDHALIWWASKSLEELGLELDLEAQPDNSFDASGQRTMKYSSDEIKTNLIERFTMENPALKKRMLAISRSSAETRFSLLLRETVLFYTMDLGLFDVEVDEGRTSTNKYTESFSYYDTFNKTNGTSDEANETMTDVWENVIGEWTNTVNYQTQLKDQHDARWHHPLQFALSIIMSSKNKRINSRLAAHMFQHSKRILLKSSSPNGLFPGRLNVYKQPTIFNGEIMRDYYWQNTFEVPLILWKYREPPPLNRETPIRIPETASSDIRLLQSIVKLLPDMDGKGIIPNDTIDQEKVVKLSDEWLYNQLDCFKNHIEWSGSNIRNLLQNYKSNSNMIVISSAAQRFLARRRINFEETYSDVKEKILGYIIDIPKKSYTGLNTFNPVYINSNQSLYRHTYLKRTPETAKKRLLHFCRATDNTALICYLSAFANLDMSTFFDRHKAYNKLFHEEASPVFNLWVTELHLSFYQIISRKQRPDTVCIPDFDYYDFPYSTSQKARDLKQISRAVMSFRFDGDFFDRHWTCHFFEYNPRRINANEISNITKEGITGSLKAHPWKQRRVLELVLFGKILQEMVLSSQVLLNEIKASILEGITQRKPKKLEFSSTFLDSIDIFDDMTSNMFKSANKSWNLFQYILQVVEEDLAENLSKIELWMKREERLEHNKPQWTLNDERNYRGAIYRLQKSNDLLVQDLTLCYNRAKSFNASLRKGLESARDEWEVESNDDIRLFTYVTVVFLPISFATGVFSMSSAPAKETLNSMITTAGLALLATVIALLYAKALYGKIVQPFFAILRLVLSFPIYTVGLLFRLVYLIFIFILAILPGKWIYLLRRHLISLTEESSSRPYRLANVPEHFLNDKIESKNEQIKDKLLDEEYRREWYKMT